MRSRSLALLSALLLGAACRQPAPGRADGGQVRAARQGRPETFRPEPPPMKGVALGLYSEDSGWSYEPLLREIRTLGANYVSLVTAYYLADIHATEIRDHPRYTAPDAVLVQTIRQARRLGLSVLLFPILRVSYKPTPDHWRGNLRPRDPRALQASYRQLLLRLARLAAREHVAWLSVGSELSSLDTRPDWFRPVVAAVRRVFPGKLLYSANWDHYEAVRIWSLVDAAGVCAYFPLLDPGAPVSLQALLRSWLRLRDRLEAWARRRGKPLVLTEVGYMSRQEAASEPWNEGSRKPVDLAVQAGAFRAFVRAWNSRPSLAGVFVWNWYGWGGPTDGSYVPRRKPAAGVVAHWYGGRVPDWWDPRADFPAPAGTGRVPSR